MNPWLALLTMVASAGVHRAVAQAPAYPPSHRDSVVEDHFGTRIADPYRWLEQLDSAATIAWVEAQTRVTAEYLGHLSQRDAIRRRLAALWSHGRVGVPWREAGRLFYEQIGGTDPQPVLYAQDSVGATPRVVLDPRSISPDGSVAVGDYAASPDGRWLAYTRARGGGGDTETRVRDLATGHDLGDRVRATLGAPCWTFDGGGFFYAQSVSGSSGGGAGIAKRLRYHIRGQAPERDRLIHEWPDARWLYCMLSDDGRWLLAVAERGSEAWLHALDLRNPLAPVASGSLVPLLADRPARHTPMGTVGTTLYLFTDLEAPRGRVLALDLIEGAAGRARPVIGEAADVLEWATVAGDRLAVHYLVDVQSRLRLFTLDGHAAGDVSLPGIGALGWPVNGRHAAPEVWYTFTSFLMPETVYVLDLRTGRSTPLHPPRVPVDAAAYETRQVFYPSRDGTRVPMFITARADLALDGSHPVLLTAYGANGIVTGPRYRPDVAVWLELGGVYAVANVRGGGEYGEAWHRAGNREHKQRSVDDFVAAAEYLVARRYTVPGKIAITGHSSGGLLIGTALTQRPDLFAVAVPSAGHYDMLRYHRFTVGAGWIPEYGSPDDSVAFRYLQAYSPLHHVRPGTCYPATLVIAADHDRTVVPSHAYKFVAALQTAQACARPVLLRLARDAGHGYASAAAALAERADMWAFVAAQLRMPVADGP